MSTRWAPSIATVQLDTGSVTAVLHVKVGDWRGTTWELLCDLCLGGSGSPAGRQRGQTGEVPSSDLVPVYVDVNERLRVPGLCSGVTAPTLSGATCVPVPEVLPAAWMAPTA